MPKKNQTQPDSSAKQFKVKLSMGNNFYDENMEEIKAEGKTLMEALSNLKSPDLIKSPGTLEIKYGDKKHSRHLNIPRIKSLFNPKPVYKEVITKSLMEFLI